MIAYLNRGTKAKILRAKARGLPYSLIGGVTYKDEEARARKWRAVGGDGEYIGCYMTQKEAEEARRDDASLKEIKGMPVTALELRRLKKQVSNLNLKLNRILGKFAMRCELVAPPKEQTEPPKEQTEHRIYDEYIKQQPQEIWE